MVISYIGMQTQEVAIKPSVKVTMKSDSEMLDEVMVVAYGTTKKSSFTGSASSVRGEKIAKMQTSNVSKSLEGAMAGVQISQSSGQPGASADIYVRGIGSISANRKALIVVDGVPYEGDLNQIAPGDIESMTVLKDAAANSLYGARGANGVVLITTKKGKSGKVKVVFENRTGINMRGVPSYDVLDSPQEYYELFWEAIRNNALSSGMSNLAAGQFASNNLIKELGGYNNYNVADNVLVDPISGRLNPNARLMYHDDWLEEAFRPGMRQENSIALSGGTEKTSYYASLGYLYDNAYTVNSNMDRINARVKIDQEVNSWFKTGFNLAYSNVKTNSPNVGGTNSSSIFYFGQQIAPIYPVYMYDENGSRILDAKGNPRYDYGTEMGKRPIGANAHPINQQLNDIRKGTVDVINAKAYAEFSFLKDFKFTVNASIDNFNTRTISFQTPIGGDALNVNGRGTTEMSRYFVLNTNQLLNWSHTYANVHNVELLLGHETKKDRSESLWAQKENFLVPDNPELDNAAKLSDASSSAAEYALEGMFAQIKYNYDEKYYFSASYRRDASSRFHPDHRWGSFWSVGGSWRINKEQFMSDATWINDLKIKASYGTQGNDNIGNNQPYKDQYQVVSNDGAIGINYIFRGNKNITWEKSNNFNAGVEFRLWDKLSGNIEYFRKTTWDLLYYKPLPPSQGVPAGIYENTMRMRNDGIEVELNYDVFNTNDFKWNISLNATHYKNQLLELPADRPQDGWATGNYFRKVGKPLYNYYDYKYAGVDPETGDALYWADELDENKNVIGKKTVNSTSLATRYELDKSPIPTLYGGFSTNFEFMGFDLAASFAYQIGGWVYDSLYSGFMSAGKPGDNWHKDILNRWTPENKYTDVPRLQLSSMDQGCSADRNLTKASYLSLRNLTFGYSLPKRWISKAKIEKLRFYLVGDNMFLLSKRRGFDPRQSITGDTGYNYSAMRTVSFGINLEF
ncbi:SusC/RagA family TonB-linked outer membrane protein [uncultured Bacteroides sp.]|uniref:SusC/RagA family TonB-linked outer membrane protein n=1 Tax=uncultured Bacteroides sp. TaxID=162156 RepID=UPI002598C9C6|nr:SusC/RagA family TonB-linked outer membrane protein [uncultured Bacteroides sp.]